MKPAPFHYRAPRTLDEALDLLARHRGEARPLAGGQSLVPLMNFRLARPTMLVDLNRVAGLDRVQPWDGGLAVGAMARQSALEASPLARERCPLLVEAVKLVGHPTIRHRGTVGGNLAHADPSAELPAAAVALGAQLVARSARGERVIPAESFYVGPLTTALEPDELLVEACLPAWPPHAGSAFLELTRTHGNFAIVGVAALLSLDDGGRVDRAALALCGVGPTPVRARRAEQALTRQAPGAELFREAARLAAAEIQPESDVHASAAYRARVAEVYVQRALEVALGRARGGA